VDPVSRREFWRILHGLPAQGMTILFSTPYMDEAERCTRVALLSEGRIVACDTPPSLKAGLGLAVWELEAAPLRLARGTLGKLSWSVDAHLVGERLRLLTQPEIGQARIREDLEAAGVDITSLRLVEPSLEDVFMHSRRRGPDQQGR